MKESSPAVEKLLSSSKKYHPCQGLFSMNPSTGSGTNLNRSSLLIPDGNDGRRSAKCSALRE